MCELLWKNLYGIFGNLPGKKLATLICSKQAEKLFISQWSFHSSKDMQKNHIFKLKDLYT